MSTRVEVDVDAVVLDDADVDATVSKGFIVVDGCGVVSAVAAKIGLLELLIARIDAIWFSTE